MALFTHKLLDHLLREGPQRQSDLCAALRCSPEVLSAALPLIEQSGWARFSRDGHSVALHLPLPLLAETRLIAAIGAENMIYHRCLDSTQSWLQRHLFDALPDGFTVFAECQTAGRGRCGRSWVSPLASQLILSQSYSVSGQADLWAGLTGVLGQALAEWLQTVVHPEIVCRFPNDLFYRKQKLGGILTELIPLAQGQFRLLIGLGINLQLPASLSVGQPFANVCDLANIERTAFTLAAWQCVTQTVHLFRRELEERSAASFVHSNNPHSITHSTTKGEHYVAHH